MPIDEIISTLNLFPLPLSRTGSRVRIRLTGGSNGYGSSASNSEVSSVKPSPIPGVGGGLSPPRFGGVGSRFSPPKAKSDPGGL